MVTVRDTRPRLSLVKLEMLQGQFNGLCGTVKLTKSSREKRTNSQTSRQDHTMEKHFDKHPQRYYHTTHHNNSSEQHITHKPIYITHTHTHTTARRSTITIKKVWPKCHSTQHNFSTKENFHRCNTCKIVRKQTSYMSRNIHLHNWTTWAFTSHPKFSSHQIHQTWQRHDIPGLTGYRRVSSELWACDSQTHKWQPRDWNH